MAALLNGNLVLTVSLLFRARALFALFRMSNVVFLFVVCSALWLSGYHAVRSSSALCRCRLQDRTSLTKYGSPDHVQIFAVTRPVPSTSAAAVPSTCERQEACTVIRTLTVFLFVRHPGPCKNIGGLTTPSC